MTDAEKIQALEKRLEQTDLLLKQEQGKRIAVERENYDIKRKAKETEEQAAALTAETQASLGQAAEDMKVALAVSQGVWALAHLGRAFLARKVCAARVVHREQQATILMERIISNIGKDPAALQSAIDQATHVIQTVKRDGEATRVQVAEASMSHGMDDFMATYDGLLSKRNDIAKGE
jgi:hypothetical protein